MMTPQTDESSEPVLADDPRLRLVGRILSGPLQNSPRLQQLLSYLCECVLRAPDEHISEERIGVSVFQRPEGYDTSVDTIVRVQVSQLRRRLEHFFLADGREEPVIIDLPKGSYRPLFRARNEGAVEPPAGPPLAGPIVPSTRPHVWRAVAVGAAGLCVALSALCVMLAVQNLRLRRSPIETRPFVAHFWRQFSGGRPTEIVLSDASVTLLADAQEASVPLSRYDHVGYPAAISEKLAVDAKTKRLLHHAAVREFTTWQDSRVASDMALLLSRHGEPATLVSAHRFRPSFERAENVVLLGNPRANPWMELFTEGLNFEYRFDEAKRLSMLVNRSPQPDEEATYTVSWVERGYCTVSYTAKPRGHGNALIVSATDLRSVSAGGHLLGDEPSMSRLYRRLGARLDGTLPHFELLLETNLTGSVPGNYKVVACRLLSPAASTP